MTIHTINSLLCSDIGLVCAAEVTCYDYEFRLLNVGGCQVCGACFRDEEARVRDVPFH